MSTQDKNEQVIGHVTDAEKSLAEEKKLLQEQENHEEQGKKGKADFKEAFPKESKNEDTEVEDVENKNKRTKWWIAALIVVAFILFLVSLGKNETTTVNNEKPVVDQSTEVDVLSSRLDAVERRLGTFADDDNQTVAEKLVTINQNQNAILEEVEKQKDNLGKVAKKVKKVETTVKKLTARVSTSEKLTKSANKKAEEAKKIASGLSTTIHKLIIEECSSTFRLDDTDLCK